MPAPVLVSVHDVMPNTLPAVRSVLKSLQALPNHHVFLLVVPGCDWSAQELTQLQTWESAGFQLCGHGWIHRCGEIKSVQHRLHSWLISRNVAEHLSLDANGIAALIRKCHDWFGNADLKPPTCYVPPAWAMGNISRQALGQLPFRYYEFQTGVLDARQNRFQRMPLVGFEADTVFRAGFLRLFNALNQMTARALQMPLRISIHPFDFDYRLARALNQRLQRLNRNGAYRTTAHFIGTIAEEPNE